MMGRAISALRRRHRQTGRLTLTQAWTATD